jgi:hypothetical protein
MRSLAALMTALLLTLGGDSQAACRFDSTKLYFGFDNPAKLEADSGKPCGFAMSSTRSAGSHAYRIAQPPHHGVAGIGDDNGMPVVGYRSAAGYRGADEFVVTFVGGNARVPDQASTIHVSVNVE